MAIKMRLMEIAKRAEADHSFRMELRADPVGVLQRETGISLDELAEQARQMSDEELVGVVGGSIGGPFDCGICGRRFDDASDLLKHIAVQHF